MCMYEFKIANKEQYAVYRAIYSEPDIMCYDWKERLGDTVVFDNFYLLYQDDKPIGGITISENNIGAPFLIAPFEDRELFWRKVLDYVNLNKNTNMQLHHIQKHDVDVLAALGATVNWSQQRMCRPTDNYSTHLNEDFIFATPIEDDRNEIIQVVYQAHLHGYTSKIYGKPQISQVEEAINRRYDLFTKTNTLGFGVIVKHKETGQIVGVCIAGIYPDSANNFSTIHQVSVLPEFRGKGLAREMMLYTISVAHAQSPVIGLTVLIGNPAEILYRKLGFIPGPSYTDLLYPVPK